MIGRRVVMCAALVVLNGFTPLEAAERMLQTCFDVAADYRPIYPTQVFPGTVRELKAVFKLGEGESFKTLTSTWIAVDVGDAAPPNTKIVSADLKLVGKDRGKCTYTQDNPLPVGKYRLEVTADGEPWKSVEFRVEAAEPVAGPTKPDDLLVLEPGTTWNYDFVQEVGRGTKFTANDLQPDADGKARAKIALRIEEVDEQGAHLKLFRNDQLKFEEWWRLGPKGLIATQRKEGDEVIKMEPPQLLVPLSLEMGQRWEYQPQDKTYHQVSRAWGPLPIDGPQGKALGYVIVTHHQDVLPGTTLPRTVTAERHFLPGVGFVREVITQALAGRLITSQEMVLKSVETR